jgi:hypothetical protein
LINCVDFSVNKIDNNVARAVKRIYKLATEQEKSQRKYKFALFNSVRNKLLVLMIALSLLPLMGMSLFSYYIGRKQIEERIALSLGKMAQDTADKVDLMLRGRKDEVARWPAILLSIME